MEERQGEEQHDDSSEPDATATLHEAESEPTTRKTKSEQRNTGGVKRGFSDWVNFAIAVFTLVGLVIGVNVWLDARESARQADYASRPMMVLEGTPGPLTLTPNWHVHHEITLVNGGKTTAHKVRVRSGSMLRACEAEPSGADFNPPRDPNGSVSIVPSRHRLGTAFHQNLNSQQIDTLKSGNACFFAFGEIHYLDDSGKEHRARYCLAYSRDLPSDPLRWTACRANNFAE